MNVLLLIIMVVVFLVVTGVLGFIGFRSTKDSTDYLLAGRKIHPMIMALSYGATFISTSAIVGFGGAAAVYGMGIIWLTFLNIIAGIFIAFVFFGRRTRKMGHSLDAHTFPELLGKRYDSTFLQTAGGVFICAMTGVAFTVGALSNVYFMQTVGKISLIAGGKKTDAIIPLFINAALPSWFVSFFFVTLLAAAMSTLSSQFHVMGTAFGRDVLEKGLKIKTKNTVLINRLAMGTGILLSTLIAWALPRFYSGGTAIIATGTAIFFGLCAAAFLPSYIGALYVKRASRAAAV
nr:hypothetical protein [Treponemataceae bacterium]